MIIPAILMILDGFCLKTYENRAPHGMDGTPRILWFIVCLHMCFMNFPKKTCHFGDARPFFWDTSHLFWSDYNYIYTVIIKPSGLPEINYRSTSKIHNSPLFPGEIKSSTRRRPKSRLTKLHHPWRRPRARRWRPRPADGNGSKALVT